MDEAPGARGKYRWSPSPARKHIPRNSIRILSATIVLDANDWFANANGLARGRTAAERFPGGVLGGPIKRPSSKNAKLFFFRLLGGAESATASSCEHLRAFAGHASECVRRRPAAAQRLSFAERTGPRQRNGRIFGWLLQSLHTELFRHPDRLSAIGKRVTIFGRGTERCGIEPLAYARPPAMSLAMPRM